MSSKTQVGHDWTTYSWMCPLDHMPHPPLPCTSLLPEFPFMLLHAVLHEYVQCDMWWVWHMFRPL